MAAVIQVKRGTASSWTSANTVLAAGEIGFETDTKKMKVGDGSTAWNSLSYTATDGDISGVTAGTGLSGGGTSGSVTVSLDTTSQYVVPSQTTHSGKYLTTDGTTSSWGSVDLSSKTDKSTLTTTGDIYYASSASTPARLGIGTAGQVLTVASGIPSWATASGASLTPYCSVNANSTNISDNVATEVVFTNENFDSNNAYNTSTGRFTPQTAGKYFVTSTLMLTGNGTDIWHQGATDIRKNGVSAGITTADGYAQYANYLWPLTCSTIIECNGTTDYISTFATMNVVSGGQPQYGAGSRMNIFRIGA